MEIKWTNRAAKEYEAVVHYLLENWTVKETQKFILTIDSVVTKIRSNPYMFKASQTHSYMRKAKITKYNSIIYPVDNEQIILLRIIDNRSSALY